jgi:hypothetical protein
VSAISPIQASKPTVHRREFLLIAPSVVIASSIPAGIASSRATPKPSPWISISENLAALWDHPDAGSVSVVKPSSAERIDTLVSGCNVGLISASRSDLTAEENQRRGVDIYSDIWPRFWSIDVDVGLKEQHGPLHTQGWTERAYLLIGKKGFDTGNLKGFVRQYGAIYDQRLVLYKPYDDRNAYLLGTRDGLVPRKRQIVCVGEFMTTRLSDYFKLIREQGSRIDVESIRFPIRKTFFNRLGGEY